MIAESANSYAARARTEAFGEQAKVTAAATVYSIATVDNDDEDESKASRASHCRLNWGFFVFSHARVRPLTYREPIRFETIPLSR